MVEENGLPAKDHHLTNYWQISHMPRAGREPPLWGGTVSGNTFDHLAIRADLVCIITATAFAALCMQDRLVRMVMKWIL